jgi:hypothetical protein
MQVPAVASCAVMQFGINYPLNTASKKCTRMLREIVTQGTQHPPRTLSCCDQCASLHLPKTSEASPACFKRKLLQPRQNHDFRNPHHEDPETIKFESDRLYPVSMQVRRRAARSLIRQAYEAWCRATSSWQCLSKIALANQQQYHSHPHACSGNCKT